MEKSGSKAKAKYSHKIADLKDKNHELKDKVEDYKDEGKDSWVRFKDGFDRDMDKVKLAIKDLTTDSD
jgi:cell division protein FtsB